MILRSSSLGVDAMNLATSFMSGSTLTGFGKSPPYGDRNADSIREGDAAKHDVDDWHVDDPSSPKLKDTRSSGAPRVL
ncbi:hypothetical protein [Paracoccus sp. T5]|uniref:hypothetical protein n=1 Tax=Paracoccus sp. T5 TaxID=3402161 RepID=UPI003ADC7FC9